MRRSCVLVVLSATLLFGFVASWTRLAGDRGALVHRAMAGGGDIVAGGGADASPAVGLPRHRDVEDVDDVAGDAPPGAGPSPAVGTRDLEQHTPEARVPEPPPAPVSPPGGWVIPGTPLLDDPDFSALLQVRARMAICIRVCGALHIRIRGARLQRIAVGGAVMVAAGDVGFLPMLQVRYACSPPHPMRRMDIRMRPR